MASAVAEALADTRVVLINGARQTGKSTLVREVADARGSRYFTLDDPVTFAQAQADPGAFVRQATSLPLVIDEAQRVPELFLEIKRHVDRDGRPGRFLLTGSANYLLLPRVADSLAGRIEIINLETLSQSELGDTRDGFIDAAFAEADPQKVDTGDLDSRVLAGGYPEVVSRPRAERREAWFPSYLATLLQRDVRDIANVESLGMFPALLKLLATRSGSLVNIADVSRTLGIPYTTLHRYLAILQAMFVLHPLPPWSANLGRRLVKAPKFYLNDSGLASYLLDADAGSLPLRSDLRGPLFETFVVAELRKQASWSAERPTLHFFRTQTGAEVDVVLEGRGGRLVGIEIKSGRGFERKDLRGLSFLRDAIGDRFVRGIVLYAGEESLPLGDRLWAMPIDALWRWGAVPN
jgi:predicted AAA+ superfamily ATPase